MQPNPDYIDLAAFQTWKEGVVAGPQSGIAGLPASAGVEVRTGRTRGCRKIDLG